MHESHSSMSVKEKKMTTNSQQQHLENKQRRNDSNSKSLGKGKTNRHGHCFKKHISLWLLFGWMPPDLRWHSLSPLTPEVSEAGNRISPQAKLWPDFFNDATINPWNAQPSKNSKATMQKQIVHIYTSGYVYRPLSKQWLKLAETYTSPVSLFSNELFEWVSLCIVVCRSSSIHLVYFSVNTADVTHTAFFFFFFGQYRLFLLVATIAALA